MARNVPRKKKQAEPSEKALGEVSPLSVDFGREDLNLMRDKINELIARQ